MFSNARNVVFTGNPTFTNYANDSTLVPIPTSLDDGMKILLQNVAKGAMHNSGERFDAPTCHPETRIALQHDVLAWVDEPPGGQLVTWMYGPAGAGKSAIAQTISEKLHAKGRLTASFFFSRASNSKGRGDETALIATLAYQLSLNIPATKVHIAAAVRDNQIIFDLSLEDQVQTLIVGPLKVAYHECPGIQGPMVIVLDGLDECRKINSAHRRVVSALIKMIRLIPHPTHKLLITSRPEHGIVAIFKGFERVDSDPIRRMELNNSWNPDEDIWTFLSASFADIRLTHPYFESHPSDNTWPSDADIDALVARSSGQFIYASVVIKYIKSEDYYNPAARLEVILQLENNNDRPYAELDALYGHIFSQIRDVEKVLTVLSLERMHSQYAFSAYLVLILSEFIGVRIEEIKFWLRPLVSLLVWEKDAIRYMHASLPDFLLNPSRSNIFCVLSTSIATTIMRRGLELLEDNDTLKKPQLMPTLLTLSQHYSRRLIPQHKIHILLMVSDFNIVETVVSRMNVGAIAYDTNSALASYLTWILTEFESDNSLECRKALVKPLSQIQIWLKQYLADENFDGLDKRDQIYNTLQLGMHWSRWKGLLSGPIVVE